MDDWTEAWRYATRPVVVPRRAGKTSAHDSGTAIDLRSDHSAHAYDRLILERIARAERKAAELEERMEYHRLGITPAPKTREALELWLAS